MRVLRGSTKRRIMANQWTITEIKNLLNMVGLYPLEFIAQKLNKTTEQVDNACFLLDLSVNYSESGIEPFWCNECATWRTKRKRDGECSICSLKKQIERSRLKEFDELKNASQETAVKYANNEVYRGARKHIKPLSTGNYVVDEDNELAYYNAVFNRARTRLKRIRIKNGTTPRGTK